MAELTSVAPNADESIEMSGANDQPEGDIVWKLRKIVAGKPDEPVHEQQSFLANNIKTSKYTVLTFLPKNLFEQFSRLANFYFLAIAILQATPISPLAAYTAFGPLIFVISVSAIKEAIEDYRRHKSDLEMNRRSACVLREASWVNVEWQEVRVGDIVRCAKNEDIPADLLLISTSGDENEIAYLDASNLDGETHLRLRSALKETKEFLTEEQLCEFRGEIECELPNNNINGFDGAIQLPGTKKLPLSLKSMLLRGCILKDTDWIIGLVIFTGHDTKLMMNQTQPPFKRSGLERKLNFPLMQIFLIQFVLCLICAFGHGIWWETLGKYSPYLRYPDPDSAGLGALAFFTFLILFSVLIPISLYVSMEMVKVAQALVINSDEQMYYEDTDTPARARTSNLNEDLGQITHVFSDKTGTLTQNLMEFRRCCVGGVCYGDGENGDTDKNNDFQSPFPTAGLLSAMEKGDKRAHMLCLLMAVCHTVRVQHMSDDPTDVTYNAASPDEGALVAAAERLGYKLVEADQHSLTVQNNGKNEVYEILSVIEFENHRKRMSTLVRCPDGQARLFTKGADEVILGRGDYETLLAPGQEHDVELTDEGLVEFGKYGLRTLVCAYRDVDEKECDDWLDQRRQALGQIGAKKEEEMDRTADMIEANMKLIGATAIEDKLQDGVPQTITTLKNALIKVWVLTGDKLETAINIGVSCGLVHPDLGLAIIVNTDGRDETIAKVRAELDKHKDEDTSLKMSLVITGHALSYILDNDAPDADEVQESFVQLSERCATVVACRVSQIQKAQVVMTVRKARPVAMSLAIGDGANDVGMIQKAHIGVGISGKEGMQAVMASDYAFAQFRFLKRLLLVHGRWDYQRISKLIVYSFYKNFSFTLTQFWFAIFSGFGGQPLYPSEVIAVFNVFFTGLPIMVVAAMDQDCSQESVQRFPKLYRTGQEHFDFNNKRFLKYLGLGVYQSLIFFFIPYFCMQGWTTDYDKDVGVWVFGMAVGSCAILTVNLKLGLETRSWTWVHHLATWGSVAMWFIFTMGISAIHFDSLDMFMVIFSAFNSPQYWLCLLLVPIIALGPDFLHKYFDATYRPSSADIVRELEHMGQPVPTDEELERQLLWTPQLYRSGTSTGYAFSAPENVTSGLGMGLAMIFAGQAPTTPK